MVYIGKRPGTVTAAAVILFIVGGWSLLSCACAGASIGMMAAMPELPKNNNAGPQQDPFAGVRFIVKEVPGYYAITSTIAGLMSLFGIAQIVAGIGLLRLNSTARLMTILITVGKLLLAFVGHAFTIFVVTPVQEQFNQQNPQMVGGNLAAGLTLVMLALTVAIQITLCFTIILFVSTQAARAAFAGGAASAPPVPEGQPHRRFEGYDDDEPRSPPDLGITDRP